LLFLVQSNIIIQTLLDEPVNFGLTLKFNIPNVICQFVLLK
jgi:hypothetical protein